MYNFCVSWLIFITGNMNELLHSYLYFTRRMAIDDVVTSHVMKVYFIELSLRYEYCENVKDFLPT